ncbi:MAG TPA: tetratricopeptide repeat protein [Methylococcales bacterium]
MSARYSQSYWVGLFVALNLLSTVTSAAPAISAASAVPVVPAKPVDPIKLVEQAEKALDQEDLVAAMKLYYQAAEQNYLPAQVRMGQFAESSQFYEESVGWYLMAATQGSAEGQANLGRMYMTGNGIEKDDNKALYWVRRAAAQDYLPAVRVMAVSYKVGGFSGKIKPDLDQEKLWNAKVSRLEAIARRAADEKLAELAASAKKLKEDEAAKRANKK